MFKPRADHLRALSAAVAVALTATPALASSAGDELLRKAVVADDRTSYTGTLTSVVYAGDRADSTVVNIDHLAPSQWRIWYIAPADAYGRLIVSNETVTYQYEPSENKVFANPWSASAPALADALDTARVERNYAVEAGAAASVAGRRAHTISMTSKYSGALAARLWVDDDTKLILRRETYHADGTIASKTIFDDVRPVKTLPKALFDLSIPPGMILTPGAAYAKNPIGNAAAIAAIPFAVVRPNFLPDGFTISNQSVGDHAGIQTLQIVYGDGLRDFSLFENSTGRLPAFGNARPATVAVGDADGASVDIGGKTLLTWNAYGLNLTLIGDLPVKELAKIGMSLKP